MQFQRLINHVVLVIDQSGSMYKHRNTVVEVVDSTVGYLAERSKEYEQETRVSIYTFSSGYQHIACLVYDMDVLRLPSLKGLYNPAGGTALIDATIKAISELEQTATLHGEHAFLFYTITDGQENSSTASSYTLKSKLGELYARNNWTVAAFVPDKMAVNDAVRFGFLQDNVTLWETGSAKSFEAVGKVIRETTNTFMENRSKGIHSSKSLFRLNTLSDLDIKNKLTPLAQYNYSMKYVPFDQRVDSFVAAVTGRSLIIGKAYYQLTKTEDIQPQKNIAISYNNKVYTGPQARQLLGLPDHTVKVRPDQMPGYTIFVQSTALNRKLIGGTNLLLMV